jgi:Zn-dependent M28 family amino/carboxypeptidase
MAITGALAAGYEGELPSLGLPRESGDYQRRLLENGPVKLRIKIESTFVEQPSVNVVSELGPEGAREYVLTGAHYDAHDVAVGALDNTSGTVVILEAARALKKVEHLLPTPVRFVHFACEEVGLLGAWHYAKTAGDLDRCRFVLNVDSPVRANPGDESLSLCGFPELVPWFQKVGREIKYEFEVRERISAYSDHFPFAVRGVPNGSLGSRPQPGMVGRGWGHTPADTVDKVNPKAIQAAAGLVARLLLRLSFEQQLPAQRRTPEQMAQTIDKSPIGWYVRQFKRFPFQPPWA